MTHRLQDELSLLVEEALLSQQEADDLATRLSVHDSAFDLLEAEGRFSSLVLDDLRDRLFSDARPVGQESGSQSGDDSETTLAPNARSSSQPTRTLDDETLAPGFSLHAEKKAPSHHPPVETVKRQSVPQGIAPSQFSAADEDFFNPPDLEHYQLLELLGRGGMGRVYKALDTRLNRYVAIKFLVGDASEQVARFLREARAQAQVEHENLCKVFEVGESGGRPFIAMQLIKGLSLSDMTGKMSLEQKLLVVKKVADGLHEAHRSGLVHRDLKPGNIMVEQGLDGVYKPYVLDFGLARFGEDMDLTMSGTILGTPGYMAPEQARGEVDLLDRRTDVYGLGATLYYLLTDKAPFTGTSQATVLMNILSQEPARPKQLHATVPRDVDTIVMKCLEKNREDRYGSARALADDLVRYLNGDPIQAQPAGPVLRLAKKIRKNKALFSLALLSIILLSVSLGWGLWRTAVRERQARLFTAQVKEIEAEARHSHLSRRHDIRPDRARLRERMALIEKEIAEYGGAARGAGNFALGWGYLVQDQVEEALKHLEAAWTWHYREPEAAYALGLCYSKLYSRALETSRLNGNPEERERLMQEARERYREPALSYMKKAGDAAVASPEYAHALIAYIEQRYNEAQDLLNQTKKRLPWFYEAYQLEAEILRDRAWELGQSGQTAEAQKTFEQALAAYNETIDLAQSSPGLYHSRARTLILLMLSDMYGSNDLSEHLAEGLKGLSECVSVLPGDGETLRLKAWLHYYMANREQVKNRPSAAHLKSAICMAEQALAVDGDTSRSHLLLAICYSKLVAWDQAQGDLIHLINQAITSLDKVAKEDRDGLYYSTVATTWENKAKDLGRKGLDNCDAWKQTIEAYEQAVRLNPNNAITLNNLGLCLFNLANRSKCANGPLTLLQEAAEHLTKANQLNPTHPVYRYQLGRIWRNIALGGSSIYKGSLDRDALEKALEQFRMCRSLNAQLIQPLKAEGWAYHCRARHAWEQGEDPSADFQRALATYREGLEIAPNAMAYYMAAAWFFQGKYRVREGNDPGDNLDEAIQTCKQALLAGPDERVLIILANAWLIKGEQALGRGASAEFYLKQAREAILEVIALNADNSEVYRSLGRCQTLTARDLILAGKNPDRVFLQAKASLDKAMVLNPDSVLILVTKARWMLRYAAWSPAEAELVFDDLLSLEQGLAEMDHHPEALAARSCLGLIKPGLTKEEQLHYQGQLEQAFKRNPHLRFEWGSLAQLR